MRVLLVEDNPDHAVWIGELLAVRAASIDLTCAGRLSEAFACLAEGGIDVVLLDLTLPDSQGLDTVARMRAQAPAMPVVVLTVLEDGDVGVKAVQMGAQDYLPKSRLDGELLHRVLRYAIERRQAERDKAQILAARAVQQKLFPAQAPQVAGYDLAGAAHPAEATSGDYFDFIPLVDGCLGIVIGDVSGHGLGPALLMSETRTCLRSLARRHADVGEILTVANHIIAEDTAGDAFVTLFLGRLDPRNHTLVYAGAGHPADFFPYGGEGRRLDATGPPLGIVANASVGCAGPIPLNPGDRLLLATDGLSEARAPDGNLFGTARVAQTIACYHEDSAQELVNDLFHAVRAFSQYLPQEDDITAVVLTRLQN
jgi:phosphoserine phosphatase RsbU/P